MEFGSALENLFSSGIDAWKDIEVSKNYAASDGAPVTRDARGNAIPQGTNGIGFSLSSVTGNPLLLSLAIAIVGGLIVYAIARKL